MIPINSTNHYFNSLYCAAKNQKLTVYDTEKTFSSGDFIEFIKFINDKKYSFDNTTESNILITIDSIPRGGDNDK